MSITVTRRAGSMLAALVLLAALLLSAAGHADAATLYACKGEKDGKVRLVAKSKKCKKSEARISWSTTAGKGVKGDAGAKGDKGDRATPAPRATRATRATRAIPASRRASSASARRRAAPT